MSCEASPPTDPQACSNITYFSTNVTLVWNQDFDSNYSLYCKEDYPSLNAREQDIRYLQNDKGCTVIGLRPFTSYSCNLTVARLLDEITPPDEAMRLCRFTTAEDG